MSEIPGVLIDVCKIGPSQCPCRGSYNPPCTRCTHDGCTTDHGCFMIINTSAK